MSGAEKAEQERIHSKFRALERSQCYFLRSPEVNGKSLRISIAGDPRSVRDLQKTFNGLSIPYEVSKIAELEEDTAGSPFGQLTATQMRILRLAHAMGYYEIPRRSSTEQLANLSKMDKGTVGRHLRRAERHLFNSLLT